MGVIFESKPRCGAVPWAVFLGGVVALCAQTRGEPPSARCEQRLSGGSPLVWAGLGTPGAECGEGRGLICALDQ